MAHFAVIAPPLPGHYRPLSHLSDALIARGHAVTFVHQEDARPFVSSKGAGFAAVGEDRAIADWAGPMARLKGIIGLGSTIRRMERFTTLLCRRAPAVLEEIGADAVIADQLEPAGGMVAEHLGIPWISTATSLPMNRELRIPPPFVGWPHEESPAGLKWNEGGWKVADFIMRGFGKTIARNADALGLSPRNRLDQCFSPVLQLAQTVPGLDWPRRSLPAHFLYVGPFRPAEPEPFDLPPDPRPTAYCTLGTLQGSRTELFRRIADACDRQGIRLVLTHGGRAPGLKAEDLPGRPLVYAWIPQEAAMARADIVISHAGMNTALEPLVHGIPMIVIPLALEQPAIAARVEASGAGIRLSKHAGAGRIADAIARLRNEPSFAGHARRLQAEVAAAGGTGRACDLIERALAPGARPEAATRGHAARDDVRDDSRNGSS